MASWEEFSRIVAEAKAAKKLDPVGHEDDDVDNDGDSDSSDSYLKKRRATVGAAIAADKKKKVEEALDPVGKEDKDIDNDGDHDKSDKYLLNRRKIRAKVIPPQERLKTDRDMFNIPKSEQEAARERTLAKAKAKREKMKEETEQIAEIAPLVVAGLAAGGAALAGAAINRAKKAAQSGVDAANKGQNIKNPGTGIAGAAYGMQKRNNALNDAMKQLRQSYELEGEMVEEDKEYRREMRKAAARERAEEKSGRKEEGKRSAKAPGRLGKSAGTSYADKEQLSIKGHDEVTKKAKHTVGNPFPEHVEYVMEKGMSKDEMSSILKGHKYSKQELLNMSKKSTKEGRHGEAAAFYHEFQKEEVEQLDEMPYQVYGSHDGKTEKKIGKPVKSRKYAHDRADELSDTHKETGGKFRVQKEENDLDEGMTMKDFKQQRSRQKQKDKRESEKTSPLRRAGIHDDKASPERAARHRANVDPDYDHDDEENMYPGGKLKDPKKIRKAKAVGELTKEEYIEEKALSRAQQRFMGMVYAAKKGGTPASPEVAKAAEGMSKKAARDFAKTKHEGLPEKKEDTKEELSLVQRILDEAISGTIAGGKSQSKKYKIQAKDVRIKQLGSAALSGDEERVEKLKKSNKNPTLKITKKGSVEQEETPKKSEEERKKEAKNTSKNRKRGKSGETGTERAETIRTAGKLKLQQLRRKEEEKKRLAAEKKARKNQLKHDIKAAWSSPTKVGSGKKDTSDMSATVSNIGNIVGGLAKTGVALGKYAWKKRQAKKEEEGRKKEGNTQKEEFSNWREEFIFEVDDQSVQNEKQKVIDVSKKKNKIEINPNMSEGCGCDEKEKKEKPQKDMRELPTKVNLLKTKARSMGVRNPVVMVASEETDNIQEIAPLLAAVARVAAPVVARGVTTRVAGSAAQGTLRTRAAEIIGQKAGEKMQNMFTGQPTPNKKTSPSNDEVQKPLGGILSPMEEVQNEDWQSVNRKDKTDGLSQKAVDAYRRENPGSKLQTAVTEKKPTGKRAERRKSFCRRMNGMKERLTSAETARDPDSRINRALRRWNCN